MYWSRRNVRYHAVACDVAIVQPSVYEVSISLAKALPSRNDREMYSVVTGSVSEATHYRGEMCIDGAARKNDYRMMLYEPDTHRHITVKHMLTCAPSQTHGQMCTTGRKPLHGTTTELDLHPQRCPCTCVPRSALTAQRGARAARVRHAAVCSPSSSAASRVLPREQRAGLSEGQGGNRENAHGRGYLRGPAEAGEEVVRLNQRVLRARYRAEESMSSARIAGAEGDGARVRDAATYVESAREALERRVPHRGVAPRSVAGARG